MRKSLIFSLNKTRLPSMEQCAECIHRTCTQVYTSEICLGIAPEVWVQRGYRCWLSAVANLTHLKIKTGYQTSYHHAIHISYSIRVTCLFTGYFPWYMSKLLWADWPTLDNIEMAKQLRFSNFTHHRSIWLSSHFGWRYYQLWIWYVSDWIVRTHSGLCSCRLVL